MSQRRVWFVVESGTDVRLVDGLAERYDTTVLARAIRGGSAISRTPARGARIEIGPESRARFAAWAAAKIFFARPGPEFVLGQGYGIGALLAQLACGGKVPSAMLICSPLEEYYECRRLANDPAKPFRPRELTAVRTLARLNAKVGTHAIALSQYLANTLRNYDGSPHIDIVPVYGVDVTRFAPMPGGRDAAKRSLDLPLSGSTVLFSSRIAPEKDVHTLLQAFAQLLGKGRDLWLVHRSGQYREFLASADRAGVAARVIAREAVHPAELPLTYAAADVCVQASCAEGLGFAALEALACETPVVATAVGGLREIIFDGETGWTCPPRDSGALADAIAAALDCPAEAQRRAAIGRKMVIDRYERSHAFDELDRAISAAMLRNS